MSPILVRPVREQFEHDRVIRLLQAKWRRRYNVATNVGDECNAAVKVGTQPCYPDLILYGTGRGRRVEAIVEVETAESVNNLEALAEWARFAQAPGAFHLYVPAGSADIARRLAADNQIAISEIWTYHPIGDEMRFTLVHREPETAEGRRRAAARPRQPKARARPRRAKAPARRRKRPASQARRARTRRRAARRPKRR